MRPVSGPAPARGAATRPAPTPAGDSALLREFLAATGCAPRGALPVSDPDVLPLALQEIAEGTQHTGAQWRAWAENDRVVFFLTAAIRPVRVGERLCTGLYAQFVDLDGRCMSRGAWVRHAADTWELSFI